MRGRHGARSCVDRFRGMFAFVLWDEKQQTAFLARDRLGVKPLYYAVLPDGYLIVGSELKSLLAHGALAREIDPLAVEEYFALGLRARAAHDLQRVPRSCRRRTRLTVRRGAPLPRAARILGCARSARRARCQPKQACGRTGRAAAGKSFGCA